jgi:hypothetical protein
MISVCLSFFRFPAIPASLVLQAGAAVLFGGSLWPTQLAMGLGMAGLQLGFYSPATPPPPAARPAGSL